MMKRIQYLLVFIFLQFNLLGQKVEVKSYVNKNNITTSEVVTFSITTNSNCQIYTPDFGGMQVIQGPVQSSSSQIITVNGKRSVQQEVSFTYQLRAPSEGNFKIKAVKLVCGGTEYSTKSIKIEVKEAQGGGAVQIPSQNADFFMRMYANKTSVYQGEAFTLNLKIFSRSQPQNIENLEIGDSKGLIRTDLNPNKSTFNSDLEIINGIRYYTTTIRSEVCFAQNTGKITIAPALVSAIFSRGIFRQYRLEAKSNSISITVKPLPSNAPSSFNGLVGSFKLSHSLSKTVLKPGEAIDLQLKISGTGNFNTFDKPQLSFPDDFEQFDPEVKDRLANKSAGITGSITYNYVLIPTYYGNYTVPAYSFSYFDLDKESYQTLTTGNLPIEVQKTANSVAGNTGLNSSKTSVDVKEQDIHHLLPYDNSGFMGEDFLIKQIWFYGILACPLFLLWFIVRKRERSLSEEYLQNSAIKTSYLESKSLLNSAKELAAKSENSKAVKMASNALKTFIKQKNNLSNFDLSSAQIIQHYSSENWADRDLNLLKKVWDQIEMFQYAPLSAEKLDDLLSDTETLIDKIDQSE